MNGVPHWVLVIQTFLSFWTSTLVTELFMSPAAIVMVKGTILNAMWVLVPAMVAAGASGFSLAKNRSGRLVESKKKRMPFIALNGLLVLLPSAFYMHTKASAGAFDTRFYAIQAVELVAEAVNLWLLSKNMQDGLKLSGRLRPKKTSAAS